MLTILVSYYHPLRKTVDVEHLGSFQLLKCNAATLEKAVDKFFRDNNIPWSNLVSMMMDSCAVMRGKVLDISLGPHPLHAKMPRSRHLGCWAS